MVDQEAGGGGEREGEGEGKRELLTTHTWRLTSSTPEFPELPPNGSPSCGAGFPTLSLRDFIYIQAIAPSFCGMGGWSEPSDPALSQGEVGIHWSFY